MILYGRKMGTLQLDGKFIVIFILSKVSSSSKNLYIKKPSVTWHGLNQDCQPTCLLRAKCWVMHQGCGKSPGDFLKASSIRDPDQATTRTVNPTASPMPALLSCSGSGWGWGVWVVQMRDRKQLLLFFGKLHISWPINLPVFYPQTIQNHLVVLHSERWEAWLGVLHFLNRKFKMAIIDLTLLTMGRLCLFKFMGNSIFPSVDQASRVISHTYNDYYEERRK